MLESLVKIIYSLWILTNPSPCIHELKEERPQVTEEEQKNTRNLIKNTCEILEFDENFCKLLLLVSEREANNQSGIYHQLIQDLKASKAAWVRLHNSWRYETNPHAQHAPLWQTFGLFGMNSNYYIYLWSDDANPEIMCDPVVDIMMYQLKARETFKKIKKCHNKADWEKVHSAVNGGQPCNKKPSRDFRRRAKKLNLKYKEKVDINDFGEIWISNNDWRLHWIKLRLLVKSLRDY